MPLARAMYSRIEFEWGWDLMESMAMYSRSSIFEERV
jgi:hypothetical protein